MSCVACGSVEQVRQLKSGLWRCQDCYERCFIVCAWPRDPLEFTKPEQIDSDRPWRKWLPEDWQQETEWYR